MAITCLTLIEQLEIIAEKKKNPRNMTNKQLSEKYSVSRRTIDRVKVENENSIRQAINEENEQIIKESSEDVGVYKKEFDSFDWNNPDEVTFSASPQSITIKTPVDSVTISSDSKQYKKAFSYLMEGDIKEAYLCADIKSGLKYYSNGIVEYKNNKLLIKGKDIHNTLTRRIVDYIYKEGEKEDAFYKALSNFTNNLYDNPSFRAVNELYDFLEHSDVEITEDGHFIAFKYVTSDYKDCFSKTFDNSIGSIVEMERNQVDEDPEKTCSSGLHGCAKHYLPIYKGIDPSAQKIIKVKVNPKDVVAIPRDYNNSKLRCCRYEVIGDYNE